MRWVAIIFVIGFLFVGYVFFDHISDEVYYLWDKSKDFILMATITFLLRNESKSVFRVFMAATVFLMCRVAVEVIVFIIPSFDNPKLTDLLFFSIMITVIYIMFNKDINDAINKKGIKRK